MVRNYKRKTEDRWTKEDLLEALLCIKDAKLKINDAARQYGISRATLYRQYQKFILAGGKCDVNQFRTCGGNPILTKVEEDVLEKTIRDLREQGFTVTSSDIKRICFEYCDSNGIPNQFNQEKRMASDDWYYGFLKRHPDVRIPKPGQTNSTSRASSMASSGEINMASITSPDKSPKAKKSKLPTPPKKILKLDRSPPKSPVHIITASPSKVTSQKKEKQTMEALAAATSAMKGRKQNKGTIAAAAAALKKPLKRLDDKPSSRRGKKGKAILPNIPSHQELIKEEIDSDDLDDEDDEEQGVAAVDEDLEEVMETEEPEEDEDDEEEDEEEEEEEEAEDEEIGRVVQIENDDEEQEVEEDVEMDEDDEEQDEAEKSDSDEEEAEEEEAEAEEDEEDDGEVVEEQEDAEEDGEVENDAEDGEEEEEADDDEEVEEDEDEDEEEEDDDDEDGAVVKTEKDDSDSDCTNDEELLEKLLDM